MEIFNLDNIKENIIITNCKDDLCNNLDIIIKKKPKREVKRCVHDKIIYRCKECYSNSHCEHNILKISCIQCNPKILCDHDKRKQQCKICNPKIVCEHNIIKQQCKTCNSNIVCEHNKKKHQCKICNPKIVCEHERIKIKCKECTPSLICIHKILKSHCKECTPSILCQHNKRKDSCKICNPILICLHGKKKSYCKICTPTILCEHNKRKDACKNCNGSAFCIHGKNKQYCKTCGGSLLCKSTWCETKGSKKYNGYCMSCCVQQFPEIEVSKNYKTKEKGVAEKVLEAFSDFTWVSDKRIEDGCSRRRPDLLLDMGSHIIIIEVDENQHNDYDCSCENKRLMEISQDVGHRPIVFIRFNPDEYIDDKGNKIKSCWKYNKTGVMRVDPKMENEWNSRIKCLLEQIKYWVENPTEKTVEVVQLFYSSNT